MVKEHCPYAILKVSGRLVAPPLAPVGGLECRRTVGMSQHCPAVPY